MEWWHSGSPKPQKFRVHKSAGKFLTSIFWIKTASSSLIIFQMSKLSTRSLTHLCWSDAIEGRFEGKSPRGGKFTKGVLLFLHENAPAHRALSIQRKLAYLGFQYLDHPLCSPDLTPSAYHLFPELKKNSWKVAIFRPTRRSLLPRRPGWTDNVLIFFWVTCKSKSNGLRSVLSFVGEYVE